MDTNMGRGSLSMMVNPGQAQTSALTAPDQTSESVHNRKSLSARLLVTLELILKMRRNGELNLLSHMLG